MLGPSSLFAVSGSWKSKLKICHYEKKRILTLMLIAGFSILASFAQTGTARVLVIHNAPDADSVDVYLNDNMLIDDFKFRHGSDFVDAPAGTPVSIDIAPATSSSSSESIYNLTTTLTADETYIPVAAGEAAKIGSGDEDFLRKRPDHHQTANCTLGTGSLKEKGRFI